MPAMLCHFSDYATLLSFYVTLDIAAAIADMPCRCHTPIAMLPRARDATPRYVTRAVIAYTFTLIIAAMPLAMLIDAFAADIAVMLPMPRLC